MAKKKKTSKVNASSSKKALTAEEISEKYTVRELREILRKNDLSVSGRKQELVERVLPILNADSGDEADSDLPINEGSLSSTLTNFGIN